MGKRPTWSHLLLPLAALVLLATCSDDHDSPDPPPRQDGWVIYEHPDGSQFDFSYWVALDPAGGKWVTHLDGFSYLDDRGTPQDLGDDTWVTYSQSDDLRCYRGDVIIDAFGGKWLHSGDGICSFDDNGTPLDKTDDSRTSVFHQGNGLKDVVSHLAWDPMGGFWIGYIYDGVDYLDYNGTPMDPSDDTWVNYGPGDGLGDIGAVAIAVHLSRGVWFGHFAGVSFLDHGGTPLFKGDDTWITFDTSDGLVFPWVTSLAIDAWGRKWIGTYNDVSCLDDGGTPFFKGDDQWATFPIPDHPWFYNEVRSIQIDRNGDKWFATSETGVHFLDDGGTPFDNSDDFSFTSGSANGLASDHAEFSIAVDMANGKWVPTSEGLCYLP